MTTTAASTHTATAVAAIVHNLAPVPILVVHPNLSQALNASGGASKMLSPFTRQRLTMYISTHRRADLDTLRQMTGTGQVTPLIGQTYPLHQAPDAMRDLLAGHARGKLVITMTDAG